MNKLLFVLSIMTLMSYGCNRDQDATDSTRGMQQEESRSMDKPSIDNTNMDESNEAMPSTSPASGQGTQQ